MARLARLGRRAFSAVRDDMQLLSTQIVDDVAVAGNRESAVLGLRRMEYIGWYGGRHGNRDEHR